MSKRQSRRFFIPPWLDDLDIRPHAFRVLCHLLRRAGEDGKCYPAAPSIAAACHINKDTVWPCITALVEAKVLTRLPKGFGGSNCYQIIPPIGEKTGANGEDSIGGKGGVIDSFQSAEKEGCQSAEKEGCQSAEKEGCKEILIKKSHLKKSKRDFLPDLPFDSDEFKHAWNEWQQHRREKKKPLTATSTKAQFRELAAWGEARSIAAIYHSIAKGWAGIFEPSPQTSKSFTSKPNHRATKAAIEYPEENLTLPILL